MILRQHSARKTRWQRILHLVTALPYVLWGLACFIGHVYEAMCGLVSNAEEKKRLS